MRYLFPVVLPSVLLATFMGCGESSSQPEQTAPATSSDFSARLKAGQGITDSNQKNDALSKLAKDAGQAGESEVVKEAVKGISQSDVKNPTASKAAISLAEANEGEAALQSTQDSQNDRQSKDQVEDSTEDSIEESRSTLPKPIEIPDDPE